jgi:hypothetical protein
MQRDDGCCPGSTDSNNCSGIVQHTWDFSHVLKAFTRQLVRKKKAPVACGLSPGLLPMEGVAPSEMPDPILSCSRFPDDPSNG